ncbi:unnamed protein product [Parnassius mnemosyne]|uniref:FP protein C-terminal domain-containing protein n=1 Tax=Parnassius mnemosyne TaxID=213953 RepID=A0AAV1LMG7_9NEOP
MKCSKCNKLYDLICLNITEEHFNTLSQKYRDEWICPSCVCSLPKKSNLLTPVRSPAASLNDKYTMSLNVNTTRGNKQKLKSSELLSNEDVDLTTLISEIRDFRDEVKDIVRQELKVQTSAITKCFEERLGELSKTLESKDLEISSLKSLVNQLQQQIAVQDQHSMRNELEIIGMPEENNENLTHIVLATCQKLGVQVSENELDEVVRVGPKRSSGSKSSMPNYKHPRPIIVKLLRHKKRDELITAARARRGLSSENIVNSSPQNIYINERLTKSNRYLFRNSRLRAKNLGFQFCWVRNGGIYIKQAENKPAIRILSHEDLDTKIGPEKANQLS